MVRFKPFEVEKWMDTYENTPGILNIAETCADSISVDDLVQLSKERQATNPLKTSTRLTYGAIQGSTTLRERIAALYNGGSMSTDNIIVTQGAINANFLVFYSLISPGDHVICVYPTYQQLYSVPESLGAEVSLWRLRADDAFVPNIRELESLTRANTKMIIINNPNNPTGVAIPAGTLQEIVDFAQKKGIIVLSDEVYRPLFHAGLENNPNIPPSAAELGYDKVIVTASMSKAYALAGIRIGWIASRDRAIVQNLAEARHYTTISVSQLDDQVASYALSPGVLHPLLERNIGLARRNASLLGAFVDKHRSVCSWVPPTAGTTAFIQFRVGDEPVNDVEFCRSVLDETKVFFVPGSHCFGRGHDFAGYVRVGYVCPTEVLQEALEKLGTYLEQKLLKQN